MGPIAARVPPLALAGLALLLGLWAGLARLGWLPAAPTAGVPHGALMVCGFLGTLIALERAAALGTPRALVVPALAAAGTMAALLGASTRARGLWTAAAAGLVVLLAHLFRLQPSPHGAVLVTAAGLWLAGDLLWLAGAPLGRVVPWWAGFLVLTIAGERLELSRLRRPRAWTRALVAGAAAALLAGLVASLGLPQTGLRLFGIGLLVLALALGSQDVAWATVRQPGLPRFIAACLLPGYAWLGAAGALWVGYGGTPGTRAYDATLHAVFLGFVFSMVFGHAPVILPGVLRLHVSFRRAFYAHLGLLHGSLLLRVGGGLAGHGALVRWGGLLNAVAVLAFLVNTGAAVVRTGAAGGAGSVSRG